MLLLMRRSGESIRINKEILITVREVDSDAVIFAIEGMEDKARAEKTANETELEEK